MKHLILGFMVLFLASVATAQTQIDYRTLITGSISSGYAVEGATKIDVSTAKTLHDRGVQFVDVRGIREWERGHVPGASRLFIVTEAALMKIVDKDEEVVFYCYGGGCSASHIASAKALTWGYENVYYFAEGYPGWKAAGYPLEKAE